MSACSLATRELVAAALRSAGARDRLKLAAAHDQPDSSQVLQDIADLTSTAADAGLAIGAAQACVRAGEGERRGGSAPKQMADEWPIVAAVIRCALADPSPATEHQVRRLVAHFGDDDQRGQQITEMLEGVQRRRENGNPAEPPLAQSGTISGH